MLSPKQAAQPNRPLSSGHHISREHRLRRKQLNSDTNASKKKIFERNIRKKEKKNLFLRKKKEKRKKKMKNNKKAKNEEMNKKREK